MGSIEQYINLQSSSHWVEATAIVIKTLPDETIKGDLHQRFVASLDNGLTVLVTINLVKGDKLLASEGDKVKVAGKYEFDTRGGYIHHIYTNKDGSGFAKVLLKHASPKPRSYSIFQLFHHNQTKRYVEVEGRVDKILRDDTDSTPHQKFIIRTELNQSVMIVVNLDHMEKIHVTIGDYVEVAGIYVWNQYGGLVHITHHDHFHVHPDGWIYVPRLGRVFQ